MAVWWIMNQPPNLILPILNHYMHVITIYGGRGFKKISPSTYLTMALYKYFRKEHPVYPVKVSSLSEELEAANMSFKHALESDV